MTIEDGEALWEGINCRPLEMAISRMNKNMQKRHPFSCISLCLQQSKDNADGLRPQSEIHAFLQTHSKFKSENPQQKYATLELIYENEGSFVYKVMRKDDSKIFILKLGEENASEGDKEKVRGESALLAAINSEYLVNCEEIYEFQSRLFVFLDYMEGGSLSTFINDYHKHYSEDTLKYMMWMSAMGIKSLHDRNVLHRDIKSDNVLCRPSSGEIKLADLGLAVFLTENQNWRKTRQGTTNWLSPEIVNGVIYSKEVDIWAYGAMLHEMGKGEPPFMEH